MVSCTQENKNKLGQCSEIVTGEVQRASQCRGSSKVSRLRAALRGVRVDDRGTGVLKVFCAGLGVMLTKSEKSKPCPGVLKNRLPPPGVVIIDEGRSRFLFFWGGVDGGSMPRRLLLTAGEGELAR